MHQFVFFDSFSFSPYAFVILPVGGSKAISGLAGDRPIQKPDQLVSCQITNAPFSFLTTFYIPKISRSPKTNLFSPYAFATLPVGGSLTISRLVGDSPIQKPDQLVSTRLANAPVCFLFFYFFERERDREKERERERRQPSKPVP